MAGLRPNGISHDGQAPTISREAVMKPSMPVPETVPEVSGIEWNDYTKGNTDITAAELVANMAGMGFQAGAVGDAVRIINEMVCSLAVLIRVVLRQLLIIM